MRRPRPGHRRGRVEEVHADDALRPRAARGDRGDRQRGGVGGEHRASPSTTDANPSNSWRFSSRSLRRGLDHEVARRRGPRAARAGASRPSAADGASSAPAAPLDAPLDDGPDAVDAADRAPRRPGRGGACEAPPKHCQLRDPGTHRAGADDADRPWWRGHPLRGDQRVDPGQ